MNEWALLVFTICIPTAIGGFLFLAYAQEKLGKSAEEQFKIMKLPLIVLFLVAVIGLLGSFFHLGSPLNAFNTLRGFGKSWMSNEIVLTGGFLGLSAITVGLALVQKKVNRLLLVLTGLLGLVDVFAMSKLYIVTQVNGWNHINTYLVFYGTVFTLGPVIAASLLSLKVKGEPFKDILKAAFLLALFGIAIQIIGAATLATVGSNLTIIGGLTVSEILAPYGSMIIFRWVLEGLGLILLGILAVMSGEKVSYSFVYLSLLVLIVAEGLSRYIFYVIGA